MIINIQTETLLKRGEFGEDFRGMEKSADSKQGNSDFATLLLASGS